MRPANEDQSLPGGAALAPAIPDYELVRPIGRGGYGEVWLARGLTGAWRAVKVVWRNRFPDTEPYDREFRGLKEMMALPLAEAGALALHHVGRDERAGFFYYVMELADDATGGRSFDPARYVPLTLKQLRAQRGRLSAGEVIALGAELARGLAALHARGLVHRDIKPSNLVLVNGAPKLADIGLVAASAEAHTFVGTEGFVPPEGPGSPAADVFALGRVLYELATGNDRQEYPKLPERFDDANDRAAFFRLNDILLRASDADATRRYRSADELARDLDLLQVGQRAGRPAARRPVMWLAAAGVIGLMALGWAFRTASAPKGKPQPAAATGAVRTPPPELAPVPPAPPLAEEKTLVVLPLRSSGSDADLVVFAEGLHEDIIATVSRLAEIKVKSRTSALTFKGSALSLSEFGSKIGADHALTGSVRKTGDKLRIQVELRRTKDEALLWQNTFSFDSSAEVAVPERIANEVANILQARAVRGSWAGAKFMTTNEEAYRLFAQARVLHGVRQVGLATFEEQIRLCRAALELDPNFMQAANLLSISYAYAWRVLRNEPTSEKRKQYAAEAKRWAEISSKLVPGGAGDGALTVYYSHVEPDPVRVFAYAENEVRALPNDSNGHNRLASSLGQFGRWREARASYQRALELDPENYRALHNYTLHLARTKRVEEFEAAVTRTLGAYGKSLDPRNYALQHFNLTGKVPDSLEGLPATTQAKFLYFQRQFDRALEILAAELAKPGLSPQRKVALLLQQAEALIGAERRAEATAAAETAIPLIEELKPAPEADQAEYDWNRLWALTYAGREEEAIAVAKRYVAAVKPTNLLAERWDRENVLAEVYAHFGRAQECTALLAKLLRVPGEITVPALQQIPWWDRVRDDPRFQALVNDPKNREPL